MPTQTPSTEHLARGKILRIQGEYLVFAPAGTNYELLLKGTYAGALNVPVSVQIEAEGRKLLTVPSGGNFVAPIFGTPKTVQGRVRQVDAGKVVLHAGVPFTVTLPREDNAIDLNNGSITVGQMVNIILLPGARATVHA